MPYLLDTNAVIALMKQHPSVQHNVRRVGRSELRICAPVEGELWYGVERSTRKEDNRVNLSILLKWLPSLPFSGEATRVFGDIRAHLAGLGTPIGPYDTQIASIALAYGLVLVTHNVREFGRVPGLRVEDWEAQPDGDPNG
jgi:tRNA(fMet)-specific endonuclease VapC